METNQAPATVSEVAKMEVSYTTLGQEIKLNANTVRKYLTKGNAAVTDQEVLQFISICKYQQLNPFLDEAFLVKYASKSGDGNAQIITSESAYMKRAEACEHYRGFKAGLILKRDSEIIYPEGEFMLPTDVLLGGWCEVKRDDRDYPVKSFVSLKDYDKGQSTWNQIKCTMIRKVAIVHAFREAFPTQLGAMYTSIEMPKNVEDINYEEVRSEREVNKNANKTELPEEEPKKPSQEKPADDAKGGSGRTEMPEIFNED